MNSKPQHSNATSNLQQVRQSLSLRDRSEDVLIAIATLGLVATVADGEANYREVEAFTEQFKKRFALSKRESTKLIAAALGRIRLVREASVIDCACDTINEHLSGAQKVALFDGLAEVLIADETVHEGEEYFLDYISRRLGLEDLLREAYPMS